MIDPPYAIVVDRLVKVYQSGTAVAGISFALPVGSITGLLGGNGAGKTTTIAMIMGLVMPTSGAVTVLGAEMPRHRYRVLHRMNFESPYVEMPMRLTVRQNLTVFARLYGVERIAERIAQLADELDLGDFLDRPTGKLSAGQKTRVSLAKALLNRPEVLLLDEPLGALDLKLRQAMQVELKRIQREVGITFVYVTHDQGEALTMSDRIAVMNDGLIEHLGTPREIYEHPATRFVAGFIGTSNLIAGAVTRLDGDRAIIEISPEERVIVPVADRAVSPGSQLELTVRPEKIDLTTARPPGEGCALRGTVAEVVYLGTSTNFSVSTTAGSDMVVFQQNSATAADVAARGDSVWLSWQPEHSYPVG
jgi:spermidine/putrescine transport system ATP-binding protein